MVFKEQWPVSRKMSSPNSDIPSLNRFYLQQSWFFLLLALKVSFQTFSVRNIGVSLYLGFENVQGEFCYIEIVTGFLFGQLISHLITFDVRMPQHSNESDSTCHNPLYYIIQALPSQFGLKTVCFQNI